MLHRTMFSSGHQLQNMHDFPPDQTLKILLKSVVYSCISALFGVPVLPSVAGVFWSVLQSSTKYLRHCRGDAQTLLISQDGLGSTLSRVANMGFGGKKLKKRMSSYVSAPFQDQYRISPSQQLGLKSAVYPNQCHLLTGIIAGYKTLRMFRLLSSLFLFIISLSFSRFYTSWYPIFLVFQGVSLPLWHLHMFVLSAVAAVQSSALQCFDSKLQSSMYSTGCF